MKIIVISHHPTPTAISTCEVDCYMFCLSPLCDMLLNGLTAGMLQGGDGCGLTPFSLARHASNFNADLCSLTLNFYIKW